MKKFLTIILVLTMVLSLAACIGKTADNTTNPNKTETSTTQPEVNEPTGTEVDDVEFPTNEQDYVDDEQTKYVEVTPASEDMIERLHEIMDDKTGDMAVDFVSLDFFGAGMFSNWFNGMSYIEGTKVAVNIPMMSSIAHVVMLIEPAEGIDAQEYADELLDNANPCWQICVEASTVRAEVKDNMILFIMTDSEIVNADEIVDAFNS